jgi:DNA-binding SARP family transcriptional activator
MEFRILGSVGVSDGTRPTAMPAAKQRALLAILLLNANQPVATDRLIDQLWDGRPPASARKVLQTYVSKLRRVIGEATLITCPTGYELRVYPGQLDLHRFEGLVADAKDAPPREASGLLRRALAEWRGPPLADVRHEAFAQVEVTRLEELRLAALEDRLDADLALGRHGELVAELRALVDEHPLRERLRARLMLALYRSGRQIEALDVHREGRQQLVEELGVEPGPVLRELEAAILRHDPALAVPSSAEPELEARHPGSYPVHPTRSAGRRGGELRVPATSFVGRGHELTVVQALLGRRDVRLVTLTGPGGAGKTRLAIEASARARARFDDGLVFVDLSALREPALVMSAVAEAIGLRELGPERALEDVAEYLCSRQVLLVLDNFEQVLGAAPVVGRLLAAAPALTILVTSRARLCAADEYVFAVPPLPLPTVGAAPSALRAFDSVALFVERGESARPGFTISEADAHDVVELCIRLDGLPLALELAAARLALLSPRGILDRLGRRFDLLRSPGSTATERHRTLRAALEWSHDLLTPPVQALFRAVGVFVGASRPTRRKSSPVTVSLMCWTGWTPCSVPAC